MAHETNIRLWARCRPRFRSPFQLELLEDMQPNSTHSQHGQLRMASASLTFLLTTVGVISFYCLVSAAAAEPATPINPPLTDVQNSSGENTKERFLPAAVSGVFRPCSSIPRA